MSKELGVGDKTPAFSVKDHDGYSVSQDDLIGSSVVLYFYPKDETPGCTEEACSFRDSLKKFDTLHALVVGVSPDSAASHKQFMKKHKLHFSLLSDEKKELAKAFGALDAKEQIIRSTFVINPLGVICWMEKPVDIKGHTERVLKAVAERCKQDIASFGDLEASYKEFLHKNLDVSADLKKMEADILQEFGIKKRPTDEKKKQ